jgi:hypothetical protein
MSNEFPGQFVFSVNIPSSTQPAEPIRTPNHEAGPTSVYTENSQIVNDLLVMEEALYDPNLHPFAVPIDFVNFDNTIPEYTPDELPWDEWTWLSSHQHDSGLGLQSGSFTVCALLVL